MTVPPMLAPQTTTDQPFTTPTLLKPAKSPAIPLYLTLSTASSAFGFFDARISAVTSISPTQLSRRPFPQLVRRITALEQLLHELFIRRSQYRHRLCAALRNERVETDLDPHFQLLAVYGGEFGGVIVVVPPCVVEVLVVYGFI
jgi:hypothetical protein